MIYKVEPNSPTSTKINEVNDMIMEVDGKVAGASFDKNEIDQIFSDLGLERQFARNQSIGNTVLNYDLWTHVHAETGYSIWKYTIDDYVYNENNQLFLDNKLLDFRGLAYAETAETFYKAFFYDGTYTDDTEEAGTEGGTAFATMSSTNDFLYIGNTETFSGAKFEFATRGTNYTLKVEYYNGTWVEMSSVVNNLSDDTSNFTSDGGIMWTIPSDWTADVVNGESAYWIRFSTSTTPITTATVNYVVPNSSVIGLLALSSSQIQKEQWAWCSFGTSIYVTLRNVGNSSYEGDYFITSSSSDTNKRNFFIYNHEFISNYRSSTFTGGSNTIEAGAIAGDLLYISGNYSFTRAVGTGYSTRAVGVLQTSNGVIKFVSGIIQNLNTVGSANIVAGDTLYLSETAGKVTNTAPVGSGKIQQKIGIALEAESSGKVDAVLHIDLYPVIL